MTQIAQDTFAGTDDPHVSAPEPIAAPTPPTPQSLETPPNPMTGEPPEAPPATPIPEGAPAAPVEPTTAPVAPAPRLSQEELQEIARTTIAAQQAAQTPAPAKPEGPAPLTPQQRQELFRPVAVTPEVYQNITGYAPDNPQQVEAMQSFALGIAEHALRMSVYHQQQREQELTSQFDTRLTPIMEERQAANTQRMESKFFEGNPDLADHRELLMELRDAAIARKMEFATEQEAFDFIAQSARKILANVRGPAPAGQVPPGQPAPPAPPTPQYKMPPTSMGGATGPGSPGQGQPKSTAQTLFS